MSGLSNALRRIQLPPKVDAQLLTAAADEIERLEASCAADHQNTIRMITSLRDIFRDEKAAWQAEREKSDKALGEVIDQRDEYHDMADRLAHAIADYFLAPIGEHSSANCPWMRALEIIENGEPQGGEDAEPVALNMPAIEAAATAYIDDYELRTDEGCHTPTEDERFLITDAVMGLLADDDFVRLFSTPRPAGRDAREVPEECRAAMSSALAVLEENHAWHQEHDDHEGYPGSHLEERNESAIAKLRAALTTQGDSRGR